DTRQRMIRNEFGGFNEAMYNLYAITKDEHYLWVARFFYHNEKVDPLKQGNNDLGTNHANTFIPKLLGECRNYELFGEEDSRRAATLLYNTLVSDHAFVTGEVSDKEHLFSKELFKKQIGYHFACFLSVLFSLCRMIFIVSCTCCSGWVSGSSLEIRQSKMSSQPISRKAASFWLSVRGI
ncbi:MAG: glycoside hydrolase family 127 protein, partial [Bacteroidales bacterium]|nr:glycoside hydrolase family 127 protein [Bacteroidales bacterium]